MFNKISFGVCLIAFLILVSSLNVFAAPRSVSAAQCSTIDLRQDFELKMRNQGDVGWCYAHASSDYLQYYFKLPTQISAADVAISYNRKMVPKFERWITGALFGETGFITSAMKAALKNGYCPEAIFPSESWKKIVKTPGKPDQVKQVSIADAIVEVFKLYENVQKGIFKNAAELPYVYEFTDISHDQFFEILSSAKKNELLNDIREGACDAHRQSFPGGISGFAMKLKGKRAFDRIDRVLEGRTPATVDFYYGVLNDVNDYSHSLSELHTTVLMGRRFSATQNQCQYLIKNSHGSDCAEYDTRNTCEGGYVWVSESYLQKAMITYVYSKDRY